MSLRATTGDHAGSRPDGDVEVAPGNVLLRDGGGVSRHAQADPLLVDHRRAGSGDPLTRATAVCAVHPDGDRPARCQTGGAEVRVGAGSLYPLRKKPDLIPGTARGRLSTRRP